MIEITKKNHQTCSMYNTKQNKLLSNESKEGIGQESIQSSTTPDPRHHIGKLQKHKEPFLARLCKIQVELLYEGCSICNENSPVNPKVLFLHTS